MASLNRIILSGKLATDAEARATMDGLAMTKFKLVVERRASLGQPAPIQSGSDLIDIIAWRNVAEGCANLKTGQTVLVEGRIQVRSFDDQGGKRKWVTEVVAKDVFLLGADHQSVTKPKLASVAATEDVVDDADLDNDLPF